MKPTTLAYIFALLLVLFGAVLILNAVYHPMLVDPTVKM
jgi:hypothetical protein